MTVPVPWNVILAFVRPTTRPSLFRKRDLLTSLGTGGNLTSDAHLAALAIEQSAELCSCDADFARFAGLPWRNPLR
jgi:predicted nucleic acid-binding protein